MTWYTVYAFGVVIYNVAAAAGTAVCSLFVTPEPPPAPVPLVFRDPGRYSLTAAESADNDPLRQFLGLRLLEETPASPWEGPVADP